MSADHTSIPDIPVGPADVTHPRRALARLALSAAAQEVADFAAGMVPTVSDDYGNAYEDVEAAARLVAAAQEVLTRAVVHARERYGSWSEIAEALGGPDAPETVATDRYAEAVERWEDALDQPWERSGPFLSSRLPGGLSDPDETASYLDRWCAKHIEDGTRRLADDKGITDRMVSANLPKHTPVTESNSVLRTATYLFKRGAAATDAEREAFEVRKQAVLRKAQQHLKA
jgi:hypothetical protein